MASLILLVALLRPAAADTVSVADFAQFPQGWESRSFLGETRYAPAVYEGRPALEAHSQGTASGLIRRISVDLRTTPYLNWSWAIANRLQVDDEHRREGDDYPARVYVIFSTGPFFWQTRTLNYVWSNRQPPGSVWPNAFTEKSTMVALRGPGDSTARWYEEKRNVFEDIRRLTGTEIDEIKAVALMTDTDNTGQQARAWYGRIYFSQN
ncbi:MAG: DUF3047 domain-containing protein [Gammaproteobacteria bacterium]